MATDSGYSNQKKLGVSQFETIHNVGSNSYGKRTLSTSVFEKTPFSYINSVTDVEVSGKVVYWEIELPSHGAEKGDMLRVQMLSDFNIFEFEIQEIVDADRLYVLPISSIKPDVGFLASILGFVTNKVNKDGEISVSVGTQFLYDGSAQEVIQDNGDATANRAFPSLQYMIKDGVQHPITKDTISPSGTIPMPVEIVAASGTPINITAGDLNVQLSDGGPNPDCVKVGDGSGVYLDIYPTGQAQVRDEYVYDLINTTTNPILISINSNAGNSLTKLSSIETKLTDVSTGTKQDTTNTKLDTLIAKDFATSAKQDTTNTKLDSLIAKDFATSAKQDTGNASLSSIDTKLTGVSTAANQTTANTSLSSIDGKLTTLNAKDFSTSAKQDAQATLTGAVNETAPASDTASSGLNGRLQRIAQRLTSLIALFPTSIGQKTGAGSLSVVLASDQGSIPTAATLQTQTGTITSAQKTVGTSAVRATVAGTAPSASRKKLMIKPSANNSGKIYLGSSGVTTSTGMEIIGPDRLEFPLDGSDYYVISDTASQIVEIIEVV